VAQINCNGIARRRGNLEGSPEDQTIGGGRYIPVHKMTLIASKIQS
jgi:hypothetical protein